MTTRFILRLNDLSLISRKNDFKMLPPRSLPNEVTPTFRRLSSLKWAGLEELWPRSSEYFSILEKENPPIGVWFEVGVRRREADTPFYSVRRRHLIEFR